MLFVPPSWVTQWATFAAVGVAFWRGGTIERLVGAAALANVIWIHTLDVGYGSHLPAELLHDTAAAGMMTALALKSDRYWTLAAASVWVLNVGTEIAQALAPVSVWVYGATELVWYWLFILCLGVGSWRAPRPVRVGRRLGRKAKSARAPAAEVAGQ
jgi:hypothetical protein